MHCDSNVIGTKTPQEYIRVTYGYIRVHANDIRINTSNIRVHTSNIRIHNDKNGNIQVTYEYIGYQEGNKHKMYHFRFTFHFYMYSRPVLRTYVSAHNCLKRAPTTHTRVYHIHASVPHTNVRHTRATPAQTNLIADVT